MANLVTIEYQDLVDPEADLTELIRQAFGDDGLGILCIRGIPGYAQLREALLPLAQQFAELPEEVKEEYTDEASSFNFGWSHGKEALQDGRPDVHKGSFYANPLHDQPTYDKGLMEKHPSYYRPNVWPQQHLPQLEQAFKQLGRLVIDTGMLLAAHCDRYVRQANPAIAANKLVGVLRRSRIHKGRLLHYFPAAAAAAAAAGAAETVAGTAAAATSAESAPKPATSGADRHPNSSSSGAGEEDGWCGWHTDHSSLTGLAAGMFIDQRTRCQVPSPDPGAGLYIRDRQGRVVKATTSSDALAFQVGESMQIHSGGLLRATPHCVRAAGGAGAPGIGRNTFAVFMQPDVAEPMDAPPGATAGKVAVGQWQPGQSFGQFSLATFAKYYGATAAGAAAPS